MLCLTAAGCAKHEETRIAVAPEHRAPANPSNFPLSPRNVVLTVVPIDSRQMFAAMKQADPKADVPKNYKGHEIILETPATMPQLKTWLAGLRTKPPAGFRLSKDHVDADGGNDRSTQIADGAGFDGPSRSVYVVAADPKQVRAKMGPVLDLIASYDKVPAMLRGPIDEEAKKQVGYTVSEMLDPASPVGAALGALKQLQTSDQRAIVLIDTSEQGTRG